MKRRIKPQSLEPVLKGAAANRGREPEAALVLILNGGSSSIRFAVHAVGNDQARLSGKIDRIGMRGATLLVADAHGAMSVLRRVRASNPEQAVKVLVKWCESQTFFSSVVAVGHRIVHGMNHGQPERIRPALLAELRRITPYDPEHLPLELHLIEVLRKRHPSLRQVACFDTAFHRSMPLVARLLAIPRRFQQQGLERYGFHGLSYEYLSQELVRLGDRAATKGRVIIAHLGSGASLAALRDGKSVDTSMGFTPAAGLVMGTRSGDLDPGLFSFLSRTDKMSPSQFEHMVNHESGMLGVSGTSSDMMDLLAREHRDPRAADAISLFCYQARKWIGSFAAVLDGLDTLVFSGGVGENSALVRARICASLGFLGVSIDPRRNLRHAGVISRTGARVIVRVLHTDEELLISRAVCKLLGLVNEGER